MDFKHEISLLIDKCLDEIFSQRMEDTESLIEIPPDPAMGDYAFPCFRLSKTLKMPPEAIAERLAPCFFSPFLKRAEKKGGYLNFYVDAEFFARYVLGEVLSKGENYGASREGNGKNICLDYSSVNIAKPFHFGHLYTTVIGNSLRRIYDFLGYNTISINHLGDWGTQFGKLIVAYKKWGDRELTEKNQTKELVKIYVKFHEEAEKDPSLDDEAREWFKKIEDGDAEALELYGWFKEITMKEVERIYGLLDVKFDSYDGEAFFSGKMRPVIDELREKNLLVESDGAQIVDLSEYDMPPMLVLRSDGASLYATRDLATIFYRKKTYDFFRTLYVVAYQQNLHFRQLFKAVELMGYDWAKDLIHVNYGMVSLEDGPMSTRKGRVVYLEDVLTAATGRVREIMREKSPDFAETPHWEKTAEAVGVGAVVFSALYANRIKDVVFSWERALNFDGETGPYVQYTHARCNSVLTKAGECACEPDYSALGDAHSQGLLTAINNFPQTIREAALRNEPYLVTRNVIAVAQAFNKFYYENRIIDGDPAVKAARVRLTAAAKTVLRTGLFLIGLKAPERM